MSKQSILATLPLAMFCALAQAAGGDTGTGAVGEMQVTGLQFFGLLGALAVLGVVVWLVAKFLSK